jgi:superfamily II RNA helicase
LQEYVPLKPATRDPAKTYPFQLDSFQQEAILCIENNQVLGSR